MSRQPRFEICRGDDGWWARFRAANGRVVFVTETYTRRRAAMAAIRAITGVNVGRWSARTDQMLTMVHGEYVEVREVDERD